MKKLFIVIMSLLSFSAMTQIVTRSYDSDEFKQLLNSRTQIVLTGKTEYDNALKEAVNKYWKITPFDYIKIEDIEKSIQDKSKSFLIPLIVTVTFKNTDIRKSDYSKLKSWLSVVNGGKKSFEKYTDNDAICISGFNYYGDEPNYENASYRLDYMVKGINDGIKMTKEKKFEGNAKSMIFTVIKEINKNVITALKEKILVINKDMTSRATKKAIIGSDLFDDAKYPYKFKYVGDSEFKNILNGNSSEYLCLIPAIEVNKHIMIYDPGNRNTVYYGWAMQGLKISKGDIKDMLEGKE